MATDELHMPVDYDLYRRLPGFVLGFHGCDQKVGEAVLKGTPKHLAASENAYDWLGNGIYFWENDPRRAHEFAEEAMKRPVSKGKIKKPFVIGAVIDLGLCLNLLERECLEEVSVAYQELEKMFTAAGAPMPGNKGPERAVRFLDRAVLETVHLLRRRANETPGPTLGKHPPYDSVRGAFLEGGEAYPNAGFFSKNHIQIAIRNPACIKGYFRPLQA